MNPIAKTAVICLLAACGSTPAATSPTPSRLAEPAPPAEPHGVDLAGLGGTCGEGQRCDAPASCVTYYGIAGPQGPAFKSCEIQCADELTACPAGTTCITIADGPGAVCRRGDR